VIQCFLMKKRCGTCVLWARGRWHGAGLEFERHGCEVLVLESAAGRWRPRPARPRGPRLSMLSVMRRWSLRWRGRWRHIVDVGGRCVAFDAIDWMHREFVGDAHWPVTHDEIRPFYKRASEYLLCGSDVFAIPYKRRLTDGLTLDGVERWSREAKIILEHRARMMASQRIRLSLKITVTGLN